MCQPIHVCGLLSRMPMRAMPLCLCPCRCFFFLFFLTTSYTYLSTWQDFWRSKRWQQPKLWNKSSVSILADIVADTNTHTHTRTLAGFTTTCILLALVLAGRLKDSLKDHLIGEVPSHIQDSCFFPLLSETFMYSAQLMRGGRWPD